MPDTMRTIAVQVKHIVKCIVGKAQEDSIAVRSLEKSLVGLKSPGHNQLLQVVHNHQKMTVQNANKKIGP